jgi:hypothetical protein
MSKASKRGAEWVPRGNVQFQPVPYKLLPVAVLRNDYVGAERCGEGCGDYTGHYFDPWQRGDLVAVEMPHHVTYAFGHKRPANAPTLATWVIGRRATVPSAHTQKYDFGRGAVTVGSKANLYRIPYRWRQVAAQLIGQEFESRDEMESAMERQQESIAA